jgi:hypothetical protein
MLNKEGLAGALGTFQPQFADGAQIPSWAWGYVNVAFNLRIIEGYPDKTFKAGNPVTAAEALAMLTRAMGNDSAVFGIWPMNYMMWGYDSGLLEDLELFANLPITRGEMAWLTVNALGLPRGWDAEDEEFNLDPLADAFTVTGAIVERVDSPNSKIYCQVGAEDETYTMADVVTLVGAASFDALLNREVRMLLAAGKVIYIEAVQSGAVVTGTFKDDETKDSKTYIVLSDNSKIEYTGATVFEVNRDTDGYDVDDLMAGASLTIIMDAGKAAYVRAFQEDLPNLYVDTDGVEVLDEATDEGVIGYLTVTDGDGDYTLDITGDTAITLNGSAADLEDLEDADIVYVATFACEGDEAIAVTAIRNQVTGTVEEVTRVYTSSTAYYTVVTVEYQKDKFRDYTLDSAIKTQTFTPDTVYFFNLNRAAEVRYAAAVGPAPDVHTIVKIIQVQDRTVDRVVVDRAGTTSTYETDTIAPDPDLIGSVGELTIDGDTGRASFTEYTLAGGYYKVYAVDAQRGTATIGTTNGSQYWFVNNPSLAVYQYSETAPKGVGAYIGLAGLKAGEYIRVDDPADAYWILRIGTELPG